MLHALNLVSWEQPDLVSLNAAGALLETWGYPRGMPRPLCDEMNGNRGRHFCSLETQQFAPLWLPSATSHVLRIDFLLFQRVISLLDIIERARHDKKGSEMIYLRRLSCSFLITPEKCWTEAYDKSILLVLSYRFPGHSNALCS